MPHAIIRGKNGRRHEVDFGDAPIRVEIYASDETVEIFVEADFETNAEERRRFAILNIPRNLFSDNSILSTLAGLAVMLAAIGVRPHLARAQDAATHKRPWAPVRDPSRSLSFAFGTALTVKG